MIYTIVEGVGKSLLLLRRDSIADWKLGFNFPPVGY